MRISSDGFTKADGGIEIMLIPSTLKTFFYLQPVDFRLSINGLSVIVSQEMKKELLPNQLFLFRNKCGDKMKALHYSHHCFSLVYCRLEKGRWIFPRGEGDQLELSVEHLKWILSSHRYSKLDALIEEKYSSFI